MDPIALALASSSVSPTHIADTEGNPVYANAAWTSLVGAGARRPRCGRWWPTRRTCSAWMTY